MSVRPTALAILARRAATVQQHQEQPMGDNDRTAMILAGFMGLTFVAFAAVVYALVWHY